MSYTKPNQNMSSVLVWICSDGTPIIEQGEDKIWFEREDNAAIEAVYRASRDCLIQRGLLKSLCLPYENEGDIYALMNKARVEGE